MRPGICDPMAVFFFGRFDYSRTAKNKKGARAPF